MAFTDTHYTSATFDSDGHPRVWKTVEGGEVILSDVSDIVVEYSSDPYKSAEKKYKSEIMSEFFSEFLQFLSPGHKKKERSTSVALFTRPRSAILTDIISKGYFIHATYPVPSDPQGGEKVKLHIYGLSIISDVLEHLPTKMAKANVIKEALAALHAMDNSACLLIIGDPSVFSVKELESLALYAGAKKILHPKCFKGAKLLYVVAI